MAVLSVALAGLLIEALPLLTAVDARPALLVAVTISALYGGLGPGVLALLLAGFLSRDPGVLLAGAALVAVCAVFRRAPAEKEPVTEPWRRYRLRALRFDGRGVRRRRIDRVRR